MFWLLLFRWVSEGLDKEPPGFEILMYPVGGWHQVRFRLPIMDP
jgi:hypothetical protein